MSITGVTTVNFGALPGSTSASVAIPAPNSLISWSGFANAYVSLIDPTSDHSTDEHGSELFTVNVTNITVAGFTIVVTANSLVYGQYSIRYIWF